METKPIPAMEMNGNLAANWKAWKKRYEIYTIASESDKKSEKIQCAQLLHLLGDEAIDIYNTFDFAESEKDKIETLKKNLIVTSSRRRA